MQDISNTFVVVLGVSVVFISLICIVILCKVVSAFCMLGQNKKSIDTPVATPVVTAQPIENRQEIIAAISAVAAEELGTDISAIRVLSFKKI